MEKPCYILANSLGERRDFHTFSKDISTKVYVVARLDFVFAKYDLTVLYVTHYATVTRPRKVCMNSMTYK